jgi:voltage-gated potassium channel
VISLAPWLSLPMAPSDGSFGARDVAAIVVGVMIALGLLLAANSTSDRTLVGLSAVAAVVAIPAVFAGAMYRLSVSDPAAFNEPLSKLDALYLAVITFTTTGFRDLAPASGSARVLVVFEQAATVAVLVLAVVLVVRRLRPRSAPAPG